MFLLTLLFATAFAQQYQDQTLEPVQQLEMMAQPAYTSYYVSGDKDNGYRSEKGVRRHDGSYDYGYYGLSYGYGENEPYPKVIGRHGLAFEKRIARSSGLRMPITPESLDHIGYRPTVKEVKFVPIQAGY